MNVVYRDAPLGISINNMHSIDNYQPQPRVNVTLFPEWQSTSAPLK